MTGKIKTIILIVIGILILILLTLGIMFVTQKEKTEVTPKITAALTIEYDYLWYLNDNLPGNGVGLQPLVTFTADTNEALTTHYDIDIDFITNTFSYNPKLDKSPELLLRVIKPDGQELIEIEGLDYIEEKGFNVTEFTGPITLVKDVKIEKESYSESEQQRWNIILTLPNKHSDGEDNNTENENFEEMLENEDTEQFEIKVNITEKKSFK